ncbi:MAG: TonB-dependent receptor, partial [Deltaproteobacteria bacterium]|nr:TonB-dependent receptor [Deltaproteobacteria bacterium]
AIYQDGIPINAPALQLGQLFDSSVQVMRGPQGTGNQRNASAGLIAIQSTLPSGEFESTLRMDLGKFDLFDLEGAIAMPMLESEVLSTRVSFRYTTRDPFYLNRCGGLTEPTQGVCGSRVLPNAPEDSPWVPAGLPVHVNDNNRWGVRGLFRFQPEGSDMDWLLNLHGSQIDQNTPLGQVIGTHVSTAQTRSRYIDPAIDEIYDELVQKFRDEGMPGQFARLAARDETLRLVTDDIGLTEPFEHDYNLIGQEELGSYGGSVRGDVPIRDIHLTTITGAESYDRRRVTDFDFSPNTALHTDAKDRAWQLTQSLEFDSELTGTPLKWTTGGYFLMERLDSEMLFTLDFSDRAVTTDVFQDYAQGQYSFGIYGNTKWEFHEAFTLSGGIRFNYDKKNIEMSVTRGAGFTETGPAFASQAWTAPTGEISLTYRATDSLSIYSKYSRGWKPGVFNATILTNTSQGEKTLAPNIEETDPESVDSLEAGASGSWLDNTLELRAAFFYYKYNDYQVFLLKNRFGSPPQFEIVNANEAQIYGVEADLYSQPLYGRGPEVLDGLSLEARFSWLESEFLDFIDRRTVIIGNQAVSRVFDFSGNRLPNTPRFKLSGSVWWAFGLGRYGTLTPRYDLTFSADVFFDPTEGVGTPQSGEFPAFAIGQRSHVLHNLRVAYQLPGGNIEIATWVRNLTDFHYKTYVADASPSVGGLLNWIGDPRTWGVSVRVDF